MSNFTQSEVEFVLNMVQLLADGVQTINNQRIQRARDDDMMRDFPHLFDAEYINQVNEALEMQSSEVFVDIESLAPMLLNENIAIPVTSTYTVTESVTSSVDELTATALTTTTLVVSNGNVTSQSTTTTALSATSSPPLTPDSTTPTIYISDSDDELAALSPSYSPRYDGPSSSISPTEFEVMSDDGSPPVAHEISSDDENEEPRPVCVACFVRPPRYI